MGCRGVGVAIMLIRDLILDVDSGEYFTTLGHDA